MRSGGQLRAFTRVLKPYTLLTQARFDNTLTRVVNDTSSFQSERSAGSSKDRQVTANETAVDGLVSTNSSISKIACGMINKRNERCVYRRLASGAESFRLCSAKGIRQLPG